MGRPRASAAAFRDVDAIGHVLRSQKRDLRRPSPNSARIGEWVLGVDENGNLTATHASSGAVTILAVPPAEKEVRDG